MRRLGWFVTFALACNGGGADKDCDATILAWSDGDGDGFGGEQIGDVCKLEAGQVDVGNDCDDADPAIHPDAVELCDGIDNDCFGGPDQGLSGSRNVYVDADGDGFGAAYPVEWRCGDLEPGLTAKGGDCDDTDPDVRPGAVEVCNDNVDDDCDFLADEADPDLDDSSRHTFFRDFDGDGFGSPTLSLRACAAPGGYVDNGSDCADDDRDRNPDAVEVCNELDDDCDLQVDDADSSLDLSTRRDFYEDLDGDGWGAPGSSVQACNGGPGRADNDLDCDDTSALLNLDDVDLDGFTTCEGDCNDTSALISPTDLDGDGFTACDALPDCDPVRGNIYPGAPEVVADGIDQDCDAADDCYQDLDLDTYGTPVVIHGTGLTCTAPGESPRDDDCDDDDDFITIERSWFADLDGDGVGSGLAIGFGCFPPAPGASPAGDDCNDDDDTIYPDAPEICEDDIDQDCDGRVVCCEIPDAIASSGWPAFLNFNYCWGSAVPCPYPPGPVDFVLQEDGSFATTDGSNGNYTVDEDICQIELLFSVGTLYIGQMDEQQCFDGTMSTLSGSTGTWAGCL